MFLSLSSAPTAEAALVASRYPSPAELDAFAQKTANSPLSIKIFPADVRVPQHKQLNKTVNGLDTTGQRYSPYPQPYQGLLAVVRASETSAARGVLKNPEGRRTKHSGSQTSAQVAPYANPLSGGGYPGRHGHRAYHSSSCKPPDAPAETLCSNAAAPGDQSLAPRTRPQLAQVQSLMRHTSRIPCSRASLQVGGEARASPSLQAVAAAAAAARSSTDFTAGVPPPQSSLALTGAVIPTQGLPNAGYAGTWLPHKHQVQPLYQHHQQGALSMYGMVNSGGGIQVYGAKEAGPPEPRLPPGCSTQTAYMPQHPAGVEQLSAAVSLSHQGELSMGQYFVSNSDCYASQVLRPSDVGISHLHPDFYHHHHHHHQLHPQRQQLQLSHAQSYGADPNLCCGLPAPSLSHVAAAALSGSSLQSLECLISEIQPPCIKERMLGRGYSAAGLPGLLEHHPQSHIQLPILR